MIDGTLLWVLIVATSVLAMFATVLLFDELDEIRHQRKARRQFWDWVLYTRR